MVGNQEGRHNNLLPGFWDILRKRDRLIFFCVMLAFVLLAGNVLPWMEKSGNVQAAEIEYIRVGLKNNYAGVGQVTIQNTSLSYGYCLESVFYPQETLYSGNGFVIQSETGSYSVYQGTYGSYASAAKDAAKLRTLYNVAVAWPASTGKGKWQIYVSTQAVISSIRSHLSSVTRSSEHMLRVTTQNGGFLIDAQMAGAYPQFAATGTSSDKASILQLSGGFSYRGRIEVGRYGSSGVTAVNVLPLEQYLYGVVPSEMSYSWPMEALKAQAVCARGYALLTAGPGSSGTLTKGYQLTDTTLHQAYKGYGAEQDTTNQAVNATKGQMVCYDNQVVRTYYFSTSGGSTEAVEDVWGSNVSYLRSVSDIYENNPEKKPWLVSMTKSQILSRIQSKSGNIGTIVSVKPEIKTQSGRIYSLRIEGTDGSVTLEKEQVRTLLGLYSTKFKVIAYRDVPDQVSVLSADGLSVGRISTSYILVGNGTMTKADMDMEQYMVLSEDNLTSFALEAPSDSNTYFFVGTGFGHGVGMSQSGARGMAEAGYTYQEILEHYFTGTSVN